jgi:succinyl-CoA synthetase beta subunit
MKIHEYQAAKILKEAGIPVPEGGMATDLESATAIAQRLGFPVVLKSQVLVGGRGKAGGIKLVKDKMELQEKFAALKKLSIKGFPVERIYIVKAIDIKQEIYCALTVDNVQGDVVLIVSAEGGVDIEETAKTNPDAIHKLYLNGNKDPQPQRLAPFVQSIFENKKQQAAAIGIIQSLIDVFFKFDCSLAEVNPLVIDGSGEFVAADAKMIFDDNALFRHEQLVGLRDMRYEEADELEAKQKNLSFVKLEGNVGCIVNGAGLAMATMDIVKLCGGQPANFLDVGGSSNPQKVMDALDIILRNKDVKAVLINIFGGITRCDDIAKGIIETRKKVRLPVPLVVRLTGTNEKEAKEILTREGMETYSTMREAVQKVVELAKT